VTNVVRSPSASLRINESKVSMDSRQDTTDINPWMNERFNDRRSQKIETTDVPRQAQDASRDGEQSRTISSWRFS